MWRSLGKIDRAVAALTVGRMRAGEPAAKGRGSDQGVGDRPTIVVGNASRDYIRLRYRLCVKCCRSEAEIDERKNGL